MPTPNVHMSTPKMTTHSGAFNYKFHTPGVHFTNMKVEKPKMTEGLHTSGHTTMNVSEPHGTISVSHPKGLGLSVGSPKMTIHGSHPLATMKVHMAKMVSGSKGEKARITEHLHQSSPSVRTHVEEAHPIAMGKLHAVMLKLGVK